MSPRVGQALFGALLFSAFGLCVEIAFTGLAAGFEDSFRGEVSLLMIPVYTLAFFAAGWLLPQLERRGWMRLPLRLPITVVVIYAIEWSFGAGYAALGLEPWHYEHGLASDFSGGHITLLYLPAWLLFAWAVLPVWRGIRALAPRGHRAFAAAFSRELPKRSREPAPSRSRRAPASPDPATPKAAARPPR